MNSNINTEEVKYEQIADYPGNDNSIGTIFTYQYKKGDRGYMSLEEWCNIFDKYPSVFKCVLTQPSLNKEENDIEQLAKTIFPKWEIIHKHDWMNLLDGFKEGYKANTINKELLDNLKRIIDRIEENSWSEYIPSAYDRAKEAIAKAEQLL